MLWFLLKTVFIHQGFSKDWEGRFDRKPFAYAYITSTSPLRSNIPKVHWAEQVRLEMHDFLSTNSCGSSERIFFVL